MVFTVAEDMRAGNADIENADIEAARTRAMDAVRQSEVMRVLYQRAYLEEGTLEKNIRRKERLHEDTSERKRSKRLKLDDLTSRLAFYVKEKAKNTWSGEPRVAQEQRTREYLEAYAKLSCQALCRELHARLPRELRDLVYERIIGISCATVDSRLLKNIRSYPSPQYWEPYSFESCYWNEGFFGPDVHREFIGSWYAVTKFSFDGNLDLIPELLVCQRPELGINPKALISEVMVKVEESRLPLAGFENLLYFKDGIKIDLEIMSCGYPNTTPNDELILNFVDRLGILFPTLHRLLENHSRIKVLVDDYVLFEPENLDLSPQGWIKRAEAVQQEAFQVVEVETDSSHLTSP